MSYFFGRSFISSFLGSKSGTYVKSPDDLSFDFSPYGNLILDLMADPSRVSLSGDKVTSWNDPIRGKSATDQSTASYRPTYISGGLNGRDILSFSGTNILSINSFTFQTSSYTLFIVLGATTARGMILEQSFGGYGFNAINLYGPGPIAFSVSRTGTPDVAQYYYASNWHPLTPNLISVGIEVTSKRGLLNINKVQQAITTNPGEYDDMTESPATNRFVIGARYGGVPPTAPQLGCNTQIARVLIYSNSPFNMDTSAIENKLMSIYKFNS